MELKFSAFVCAFCASLVLSSHAASTTNGKLLKFYPITKQNYRDIIALTKRQPIVPEADIVESHRSLADWSSALQSNWNLLLNNYGEIHKNITSILTPEETYPICVMKTQVPVRRRRSSDEHNDSDNYAGLAPIVPFSNSYHETPHRRVRQIDGGNDEDIDVENNTDNEEGDGRYVDIKDGGNVAFQVEPHYIEFNDEDQDDNPPNINCIVVVKRRAPSSPNAYPPYPPYTFPYYPYPPPHGYPQQMPPHIPYPPYPYPPHPYPYNYYPSHDHKSSRSNEHLSLDPVAVAQYRKIIAKYYRHLNALHDADTATDLQRSEPYQNQNDDDDDRKKESSKKKRKQ